MIEIIIRNHIPDVDNGYIYSTWSKYAWYSPESPVLIPKDKFFKEKVKEITHILSTGIVKIACIKSTPKVLIGYVVVFENKLKWMCIKKDFRKPEFFELLLNSVKDKIHDGKRPNGSDERNWPPQGSTTTPTHF